MIEEQKLEIIQITDLTDRVKTFSTTGFRLIHMTCAKIEGTMELTYAFDKDYAYESVRLLISDPRTEIPSISSVYWCAFLYENEIHDLFGLTFQGMAIDFKGNFYRVSVKTPFNLPEGTVPETVTETVTGTVPETVTGTAPGTVSGTVSVSTVEKAIPEVPGASPKPEAKT